MRKLIVLPLVMLSFCLCAQVHNYRVDHAPRVQWNPPVDKDLAGYWFHIIKPSGDTIRYNVLPTETSFEIPESDMAEGEMKFGILAYDSSGIRSQITWAHTQCSWSAYECWKVTYDTTAPGRPFRFLPAN